MLGGRPQDLPSQPGIRLVHLTIRAWGSLPFFPTTSFKNEGGSLTSPKQSHKERHLWRTKWAISVYVIYTPNIGFGVTIFDWEREQRGAAREHTGASGRLIFYFLIEFSLTEPAALAALDLASGAPTALSNNIHALGKI